MPSDREILDQIEAMFSEKSETPFDEDYDSFIESLSFSKTRLDDIDPTELKKAWTNFLRMALESDTSWEWPCNVGMAQWYATEEKLFHAIAVYEHLLREVRLRGLSEAEGEYCDMLQEWLQRLFQLCQNQGLTERALHIAETIGDFHGEGVIGPAEYAEVLASIPALRRRERREIIERECAEAEKHYRESFGTLIPKLHENTKRILIRAEEVSAEAVRKVDPAAAPLCWALAVEAEFDHKVYGLNKDRLDLILGEERPRRRQKCGIGQISLLLKKTYNDPLKKPLVEKEISLWRRLLTVPDILEILSLIQEHRNQIAHVTERGIYTQERSNEFVRRVRESGWLAELLSALQSSR